MNFIQGQQIILDYQQQELKWRGDAVPFEDNQYMESLVRVSKACRIPPYTAVRCLRKEPSSAEINEGGVCEFSAINTGFIANETGLMVANTVTSVNKRG